MTADDFHAVSTGFSAVLALPFGGLGILADSTHLRRLEFLPPASPVRAPENPIAERAASQIMLWLDDPERPFDLPLAECGTPFRIRVWRAISAIACGERRTYGSLAEELGSAPRAVGQACGANPFPIVVPCHRVVSSSGLGGFANATAGYLMDTKCWLLQFEAGCGHRN